MQLKSRSSKCFGWGEAQAMRIIASICKPGRIELDGFALETSVFIPSIIGHKCSSVSMSAVDGCQVSEVASFVWLMPGCLRLSKARAPNATPNRGLSWARISNQEPSYHEAGLHHHSSMPVRLCFQFCEGVFTLVI